MFEKTSNDNSTYFDQPIVYDGRNFILTLVKEGKPGETYLIISNGWTIKDPFSQPVRDEFSNAWVFGLYYKLSNPDILQPRRRRVKKLLKRHNEFFGCEGLYDAGKELEQLVRERMSSKEVLLVGHTKSANMLLNDVSYGSNVDIIAICPMFKGNLATMPEMLKKYLGVFSPIACLILTDHIVDRDISVGSRYLKYANYSKVKRNQVSVVISSLDEKIRHNWLDTINPANVFFGLISIITDKAIREQQLDETGYKSNAFLSYKTQFPPFAVSKIITVYASLPITFRHREVIELINTKIIEKNAKIKH